MPGAAKKGRTPQGSGLSLHVRLSAGRFRIFLLSFRENSAASCRVAKSDLVDRDEKIFFEHSSFGKPRRPATLRSSMPAPARSASFLLTDAEYLGVTASFHRLKTACTIPFITPRTRCPRPAPAWSISSMAACSSGDMSTPF